MTPHYADDWLTVYHGDSRAVMAEMVPESVHCVVTSPPYWGLRDYGDAGQLGLEPTPEAYVANMVEVFREVRRVLRSDGTVWLNLGDSYAGGAANSGGANGNDGGPAVRISGLAPKLGNGLKPKDLVGIPWRVAFALQADGWYLRSDIIWSKPNPMPESVTDRPTKSHEYLFLLSKSPRYYFDADAVREGFAEYNGGSEFYVRKGEDWSRTKRSDDARDAGTGKGIDTFSREGRAGRNIRSVWTIATAPYPGAHFATFPPKLVEPCIKAGTSERGVCPECGAPWVREVERTHDTSSYSTADSIARTQPNHRDPHRALGASYRAAMAASPPVTTGWRPSCRCEHDGGGWVPVPATVLDPFAGSGTTGMVAQSLSRRAVLIDLSMDYLDQLMERNRDIPLGM